MAKQVEPTGKRGRPIKQEDVDKAERALIASGGNRTAAAKAAGISYKTLKGYLEKGLIDYNAVANGPENLQALELFQETQQEQMATELQDLATSAVRQSAATIHTASPKDAMTIAGIAIDKARLIEGKATKVVDLNVNADLETLRRHGVLIEAEAEEIIDQ